MSLLSKTQVSLTTALVVAILGGGSTAHAQTFSFIGSTPGSQIVTVSSDGGADYQGAYAGRYQGNLNGAPVNIFCVDVTHSIHAGDSYTANTQYHITDAAGPLSGGYYQGGLASAITTNDLGSVTVTPAQAAHRSSEVAWLSDNFLNASSFSNSINTNVTDNLTAINLSIWDIVRDGGDGLSAGQLRAENTGSYGGLVTYYEGLASAQTSYQSSTATWIQAPQSSPGTHLQDYVYTNGGAPAVPEPGVPTILACLGAVVAGISLRLKMQAKAGRLA